MSAAAGSTETGGGAAGGGISLQATPCAICKTMGNSTEVYAANFDPEAYNPAIFSARRMPDRIHSRMVRCNACGLLRADPVADAASLTELYRQSTFDYGDEVDNLKSTYGRYLEELVKLGCERGALLEIGCGNGFVLEEALRLGWKTVWGVEPSSEAVAKAAPAVAGALVCDIMRPGLFEPDTFDAAAMFQVFDHLPDPGGVLDECLKVLKPGGFLLCLNHNLEAASNRAMGEKSPIIDIEHTYLYGPETMRKIAESRGFEVVKVGTATNRYSLHYLMRLLPLPGVLKRAALGAAKATGVGKVRMTVPLGNLFMIARKPVKN